MATTRIIAMHKGPGKTIRSAIAGRIDYAVNPEKTGNYEFVTSYRCDYHTADAEFELAKAQYEVNTGRKYKGDILAYQIRQSFAPGEVTPEEANRLGYALADRLLKGKHAFIVATHTDKAHIHNHIIFNSVNLDCNGKWKDVFRSYKVIAHLSDLICAEHNLSVVINPQNRQNSSYNKWKGYRYKPSNRKLLCWDIDEILASGPKTYETFIRRLGEKGYTVNTGRYVSVKHILWQQGVRLDSLGDGYSPEHIKNVILKKEKHIPTPKSEDRPKLLIDIESKIRDKGPAYINALKVANLKQMAKTYCFLQENHISSLDEMRNLVYEEAEKLSKIENNIKMIEAEIAHNEEFLKHIRNYAAGREIYAEYKKSGFSRELEEKHHDVIQPFIDAKHFFDKYVDGNTLPKVSDLNSAVARLRNEKGKYKNLYYPLKAKHRDNLIRLSHAKILFDEKPEKDERVPVLQKKKTISYDIGR
ncbi:MAG: relaxase/mobilization nuclease domain-containing protein [Clostridia bacterium]|nr:relaxase/mobilization nuclease domain-containing protein [Clostridia bacterium]